VAPLQPPSVEPAAADAVTGPGVPTAPVAPDAPTVEHAPADLRPATDVAPAGPAPAAEPGKAKIDVRPVLVAGVREIAGEVRNSLDFHRSQGGGAEVTKVVLSGAALQIAGFAEALRSELSVPVATQTVALGDGASVTSVSAERLAVAAGLAVEEAPR
jgi:type IV pilus assembly protein PilM